MKFIANRAAVLLSVAAFSPFVHTASAQNKTLLEKPLQELFQNVRSQTTGDLPSTRTLSLNLSLPLRNEDQLNQLLQQISDPSSPNYHHYISTEQFIAQYAPAQRDYDLLIEWAKSSGLSISETPANRNYLGVQGSVGLINAAFHVSLKSYVDLSSGRPFYAPQQEPSPTTPVQLLAITGLDTIAPIQHHHTKASATAPVSNATGSGPGGNFTPTNIRDAYYPSGSLNGSGQSVAIFSYDGYLANDLNIYYQNLGITQPVYVSNILVNGYSGACTNPVNGSSTCEDAEQILDIAAVAGMAPGLGQIYFYEGSSSTSILNRIVSDNLVKVVTSSWSGGDFGSASESIFRQMQAQGMTYFNASGDGGAYATNPLAPALSPSIAQVGGTHLTTTGGGGTYSSESAWPYSGGGWIANTSAIPAFQQSAVTSANGGSTSWRNSPDVSAEADNDNPTVDNGVFSLGYGGTSFAAPRWGGLVALANQQAAANCEGPVGFIPPTLYATLNSSNYSNDFHDITSGNNANGSVSYNAVSNYDLVTGLGSPTGQNLINLLAPVHSTPTATSVSFSYSNQRPTTFSASVSSPAGAALNSGYVTFSYSLYGNTTQACSASVVNGNASCTVNVNNQTNQYTLTAAYSGNTSQYSNGCNASSSSRTAIGLGYGFN
jgi:xanthomonalisin